jgi:23S rRNA (guanosine2251-2'-O)-methyltransferase
MIFGIHAVAEALAGGRPIERIHLAREVRSARIAEILRVARERGIPVRKEDRSVLDRLAGGAVHQGVIAVAGEAAYARFEQLFDAAVPCILMLDGVEDPHNLGAVIRTADAGGVAGVVVPERHSAPLSAVVAKASSGAVAHVPVVRVVNLVSTIEELKSRGIWIVGVDAGGEKLWTEFDYTVPVALIFGGENRGIRRLVREHCDVIVRLPMLGKVASLNVSVAAGVVLYEVVRQRQGRSS